MNAPLRQWGPYLLSRLGPAGSAGLILLIAAAVLNPLLVQPRQEVDRQLEAQLARQSRSAQAAPLAIKPRDSLNGLASAAQVPEAVAHLFAAAEDAGVLLDKGDYRLVSDKAGGVRQYQITLPLTGSYPILRAFINDALQQPGLALDSLKLGRATVETDQLEAQLQLTLYVRGQP